MRVEETDSTDAFKVSGRGELHLSILIEQMRRQNYEFQVSRPNVIYKEIDGRKYEPIELLMIEVPDSHVGAVMEKLGTRKAELVNMGARDSGTTHLEFKIPARGIMGYRSEFLTDTNGNGIMNHVFDGYEPYKGDIQQRSTGSIVVHETGESTAYGLFYAQDRGRLFIGPGVPVYEGMIVGSNPKGDDIVINVCKKKHVTNTRAAGSDEALKLTPHTVLSLEQSLEFIADDELVEITPESIRMRKVVLSKELRMKQAAKKRNKGGHGPRRVSAGSLVCTSSFSKEIGAGARPSGASGGHGSRALHIIFELSTDCFKESTGQMNIVVLDLEWNGAYSRKLRGFINEIIEIGAVKLDKK